MRLTRLIAIGCAFSLGAWAGGSDVADAVMNRNAEALRTLLAQKTPVTAAQADGTTALHWAAHWNDLPAADLLIRAGADVKAANGDGATPMFLAAQNGSAAMIEKLIKAGADVNGPILAHGETALMMASRTGNAEAVKLLLDRGADVNAKESLRGTTATMWAAEQGHTAILQLLADHGADLKAQSAVLTGPKKRGLGFAPANKQGVRPQADPKGALTALMFAAREGTLDCVQLLVKAGSDVNQVSADGSSALVVAVQNGNYGVAGYLLDHGANPNLANKKNWTPLYLTVKNRNQETTAVPGPSAEGSLEFMKTLLDKGADANARIKDETEVHQGMTALWLKEAGATPLLRAALSGDLVGVRLLLEHGADPSIPTFDHTTPLMVASGVGWAEGTIHEYSADQTLELVKLLLDKGADVKAVNDHGITALHGAAYKGANQVVQLLVDRGADLAAQDKGEDFGFGASSVKMTPLNWAEGVPIGMSSAIFHKDTVTLMTRLMQERGIPVVSNTFTGQKAPTYTFGGAGAEITPQ
jgi:ankyrin repeat protein